MSADAHADENTLGPNSSTEEVLNSNLLMGNPSKALADPLQKDNFLMDKTYFSLSYNNGLGRPNWVSWRLSKAEMGDEPRVDFYPDEELPAGFSQVIPDDYTGSGLDRGHMCPHSDRDADPKMNESTFVMTNIIPQSPNNNQKAWRELETYARSLVAEDKVLHIISGPYGVGGTGSKGEKNNIGQETTIQVPAQCWKVIMVLDGGSGDDRERINANTRLIAVIMPNDMSVGEEWAGFRVSVNAVEALTGYTFFDQAPQEIIAPLKAKVDDQPIPSPSSTP